LVGGRSGTKVSSLSLHHRLYQRLVVAGTSFYGILFSKSRLWSLLAGLCEVMPSGRHLCCGLPVKVAGTKYYSRRGVTCVHRYDVEFDMVTC
jgi:hypothetical protein